MKNKLKVYYIRVRKENNVGDQPSERGQSGSCKLWTGVTCVKGRSGFFVKIVFCCEYQGVIQNYLDCFSCLFPFQTVREWSISKRCRGEWSAGSGAAVLMEGFQLVQQY